MRIRKRCTHSGVKPATGQTQLKRMLSAACSRAIDFDAVDTAAFVALSYSEKGISCQEGAFNLAYLHHVNLGRGRNAAVDDICTKAPPPSFCIIGTKTLKLMNTPLTLISKTLAYSSSLTSAVGF